MEPVIRVESLGKQYRIGERRGGYQTLRESIMDALRAPFKRTGSSPGHRTQTRERSFFWALKDISLEVQQGDIIGIIGRNGSGKSTLLKVLSGITDPSAGRAEIRGRLGSLLEVGTGFHPELTGRENIFFNGAILGMKNTEILSKFDDIVGFSGISKFIDTPVKFYSSGMYLRLAFSVAAHLETDILLIDEVLAVGDAQFQRQCLNKMAELASDGRTVLFVSHNMQAVTRLCRQGLVLDEGSAVMIGSIQDAVRQYNDLIMRQIASESDRTGKDITVSPIRSDPPGLSFLPSDRTRFDFEISIQRPQWNTIVQFGLITQDGTPLILQAIDSEKKPVLSRPGKVKVRLDLPPLWLKPAMYPARIKVIASAGTGKTERFYSDWSSINIVPGDDITHYSESLLSPEAGWEIETVSDEKTCQDQVVE